jgi:hypothetical protein
MPRGRSAARLSSKVGRQRDLLGVAAARAGPRNAIANAQASDVFPHSGDRARAVSAGSHFHRA